MPLIPRISFTLFSGNATVSENAGSSTAAQSGNSFSIARVLILLLVAATVTGGVYLALFMERGPKPLYPFSGQVLLNGKPVTVGAVMTQSIDDEYGVGIGELDKEGRFRLRSNDVDGVTAGTHRVAVSSMAPGIPPRPLVPSKYLNQNTTPLTINVTSDPSQNTIVLELEGEVEAPPALQGPPGGGGPGAAPGDAPGPPAAAPNDGAANPAAPAQPAPAPAGETPAAPQ